ncbi:efflux RND transporter periplasmic adaptor subunit [candidate division KSB1 bacterium]|nr:efflux RND transporter periplasmic adaptor subunit [candidate division KSB1 bacterium]
MKRYLLVVVQITMTVALFSAGCKATREADPARTEAVDAAHEGHGHDAAGSSRTVWQDSLEVFTEWTELVTGKKADLLVRVTDLHTFKPVTAGTLTVALMQDVREIQSAAVEQPTRPGIYRVQLACPAAGEYELVFTLNRDSRVHRAIFDDVDVWGSAAAAHDEQEGSEHSGGEAHAETPENDDHAGAVTAEAVSFPKEQQWQLDFGTQPVSRRTLSDNIRALGEIKAAGVGEAEVFAPFDGVLMPDPQHGIVRPGQVVAKGEVLARIAASGGPESGWTQLLNDYKLANAEFDRVSRLAEGGAVSTKRREEARLDLENKRSRLRGALGGRDTELDALVAEGDHFHLRAPASGVITDTHLRFGQHVETGEHLFNIVDPSRIWLEVQVPVSESGRLDQVSDAAFTLSGSDQIHRVSELGGKLVTVSPLLDPATRRVPVIFEFHNTNAIFRPGSYAHVYLKTRSSRAALTVPESSILDEDGTPVVYVQIGGEEFVRRIVQTGAKDEGYIEILDGLVEGERVVATGAYKVRLASLKTSAADAGHAGHGH